MRNKREVMNHTRDSNRGSTHLKRESFDSRFQTAVFKTLYILYMDFTSSVSKSIQGGADSHETPRHFTYSYSQKPAIQEGLGDYTPISINST